MAESKKYIGITIGPIFDMMSLVSTPAALWATSYMFSSISKKTCEKLHKEKIRIISPFFDSPENELFNKNDGIGLFHDRIIIDGNNVTWDTINLIKSEVLAEVSEAFGLKKDELAKRVLFVAAEIDVAEGENPILKGGKILDSLELSRKVVFRETENPILANFTGALPSEDEENSGNTKEGKNEAIKEIAKNNLGINTAVWTLIRNKKNSETGEILQQIKSLPAIAAAGRKPEMKKHSYYAIVRSDGDNMSKIIERLPVERTVTDGEKNNLTLSDFSKICLEYCSDVAKKVTEFNGVPIYSSGDDLLAIMPCDSGSMGTVFDFVKDVNKLFKQKFNAFIKMIENENEGKPDDEKIAVPSLSFGISICFKKFPLYEALADSAKLLFDIAKSKKNCTAVRLQKHSGQSEGLLIYNDVLDDYLEIQNIVLSKNSDSTTEILLSALYKTEQFAELFLEAKDNVQIENLFKNTFDAVAHNNNDFVHKHLPCFYNNIRSKKRIFALSEKDDDSRYNDIRVFNFALRILKFFVEKGGKEV